MDVVTPTRSGTLNVAPPTASTGTRTLAIDIGGTGLKALVLGPDGVALTERVRVDSPKPATPTAVLRALWKLIEPLGDFDRVSCGFPGIVIDGVVKTAPNLHVEWRSFDLGQALADSLRRPVRVLNDAGVQGYGVIEGKGVEMVITLGTGFGCALYNDGHYVPNIELGHHPFGNGKTYEDYVGAKALRKIGKKKWNRRVRAVVAQLLPIFNPNKLYIGGGNAKELRLALPPHVFVTPNIAGLLGGVALWQDVPARS
jgi:polyphosphate glucokinase